jgi:uncharacterized membrane protein YidH (DUF202 family)
MKNYMVIGIILIVVGIAALVYQGVSYTTREKAIDLGPIQVTTEQTRNIPLPPIVGGIALAGGVALLVMGNRRSAT